MLKVLGRFGGGIAIVAATVGAGASLALLPIAASPAGATGPTITVNEAADGTATAANCVPDAEVESACNIRSALAEAEVLGVTPGENTTITLPDANDVGGTNHIYPVLSVNGANDQLDVNDNTNTVTINGAGATASILQAACSGTCPITTTRVLKVETGTIAVITGVTIEDGNPGGGNGGGILNCGTLTLSNSFVSHNMAAFSGGGIESSTGGSTTLTSDTINNNTQYMASEQGGGGIYVVGEASVGSTLDISSSDIQNNVADGGDGGGITLGGAGNVNTVATVDGSTIFNNTTDSNGGGIAQDADSTLTVTNSTIIGNGPTTDATIDGGGVFLFGDSTSVDSFSSNTIGDSVQGDANTAANGGGVFVGAVDPTFSDDTISDNTATTDGGGVYLGAGGTNSFTDETISDNQTTASGGSGGGVFIGGGTNTFSGASITGNQADNGGFGGGVFVVNGTNTFTDSAVDSNQVIDNAGSGGEGGGFFYDGGASTFSAGTIDSNQAYEGGGAYLNTGTETFTQADISSNDATESGAGLFIFVENVVLPTTITSSTISQNRVGGTAGTTVLLGDGGGILAMSCEGFDNQINLTNDTIAGNVANGLGGGYFGTVCPLLLGPNQPAAKLHATSNVAVQPVTNFLFDTIDANTSGTGGGNINTSDDSTLEAAETIIADGVSGGIVGTNCTFTNDGTLTSGGYNLIDDSTCGTAAATDIIGQPAQLGALANNGGPTSTKLPASTSPAVGAVPAAVCTGTGVATDQRGNARGAGLGGSCTIGAVEVAVAAPPAPPAFNPNGYRLVANEGGIFDFGLNFNGSLANNHLNAPIVGIANSPGPNGYLMAGGDGGVFALGGANFFGSLGSQTIPSPIAGIAAPPTENGYWLVAQNGMIYNYGAVPALPALSLPPGAHIVGMASTQDGQGAWLTDQLGDVYAEGDAQYVGGLGGVHINMPIVGIAAAASGQGYALAATDGGVFSYGTQGFFGSVPGSLQPGQSLVAPIVGIAVTHSGNGYWMVGSDGGVFNYGDAPFLGSIYTAIGNHPLNGPIVGIQHLGEPSV
jgi:hypothetical protein